MIWLITGLAAVVALSVWISWYCYRRVFYNPGKKEDIEIVPRDLEGTKTGEFIMQMYREATQIPFQPVSVKSRDGLVLSGRYYCMDKNAPLMIRFHGYRSNALRDYAGGHRMGLALGYNTLVVDQRAHGESQGHTISFGILERYDCLTWARYAAARFGADVPIVLSGISMGAATVLMASDLRLPKNVKAIIADCSYSSPGAIIRKVCSDLGVLSWLGYPFIALGGLLFGRFCIWRSSPIKSVKNTDIPILLIHGKKDSFVPCKMSKEIYDSCKSRKKLLLIQGAEHGLSCLEDTEKCTEAIKAFLEENGVL